LKKNMIQNGWRRSDIMRYFSTMPIHGVYFVSMLSPPGLEKELSLARLGQKHQQCSHTTCAADHCEEDYRTTHVFESCPVLTVELRTEM
jgi:hypothetical protein